MPKPKPTNQTNNVSNDETKIQYPNNPFGVYGKAIKPRACKHDKTKKAVSVLSLNYAPQDNPEWVDRCVNLDVKMDAIKKHVQTNPQYKFVKRQFILAILEKAVDEYIKEHNITL